MHIESTTLIKTSPDVVAADLGGDVALLSLSSGVYYNLNETGAFFWSELTTSGNFDSVVDTMMETYDVDREILEQDLRTLAAELLKLGLITIEE